MTIGAFVDAGVDRAAIEAGLASLGTGASFIFEKTKRQGIAAAKFSVTGGNQVSSPPPADPAND